MQDSMPSTKDHTDAGAPGSSPRKGRLSRRALVGLAATACISILCFCVADTAMVGGLGFFWWNKTHPTKFTLGPVKTYTVAAAKDTRITDSVTGQTLRFPDGGSGNVRIAKITSGPAAPFNGQGIHIEYQGKTGIQLMLKDPGADKKLVVMGYGYLPGSYVTKQWFAVPLGQVVDGLVTVDLAMPFELSLSGSQNSIALYSPRSGQSRGALALQPPAPAEPKPGSYDWMISKVAEVKDLDEKVAYIQSAVTVNVEKMLDTLPGSIQEDARAARLRLSPVHVDPHVYGKKLKVFGFEFIDDTTAIGDPYYTGFGLKLQLAGHGPVWAGPTIHINPSTSSAPLVKNLAHETGHYISHILMGDDNYVKLESQTGHFPEHGIGTKLGARDYFYVEEPAYFGEYFLTGAVGSGTSKNIRLTGLGVGSTTPATYDWPSIEGFGFLMLESLTEKQRTVMPPVFLKPAPWPVVGATYGEVFEIISKGATGVDQLLEHIRAFLEKKDLAEALPAIAERNGWRYMAGGRLLDLYGDPLEGFTLESISRVGCNEYRSGRLEAGIKDDPTDAEGKFNIIDVFPSDSLLRATGRANAGGSQAKWDIPINIQWDKRTQEFVNLGDQKLGRMQMFVDGNPHLDPAKSLNLAPGMHTFKAIASGISPSTRSLRWDWFSMDEAHSVPKDSGVQATEELSGEFVVFTSASSWWLDVSLYDTTCGGKQAIDMGHVGMEISGSAPAPTEGESHLEAPTLAPTAAPTAAPTLAPTEALTATPTATSAAACTLRGTVNQLANCRYGPGAPYLYKYGVRNGTQMEVIGRDADGNWLQVQGVGAHNACWIKADLMQVDSDVMCLPDAYPYTKGLPISPFFERPTILHVSNSGGSVTAEWLEHTIRSDLKQDGVPEFIVEVWTCVGGKPAFYALGTDETSLSFDIDNSCGLTSRADVIGQDKEGFSPPAIIAIP